MTNTSHFSKPNEKGHNVSFNDDIKVIEIENDNNGHKVSSIKAKKKRARKVLFYADLKNQENESDERPEITVTDTEGNQAFYLGEDENDNEN